MDGVDDLIAEQIAYYRNRALDYDRTSRPPGDSLANYGNELFAALDRFRRARGLDFSETPNQPEPNKPASRQSLLTDFRMRPYSDQLRLCGAGYPMHVCMSNLRCGVLWRAESGGKATEGRGSE
jgi:hypothetical protein